MREDEEITWKIKVRASCDTSPHLAWRQRWCTIQSSGRILNLSRRGCVSDRALGRCAKVKKPHFLDNRTHFSLPVGHRSFCLSLITLLRFLFDIMPPSLTIAVPDGALLGSNAFLCDAMPFSTFCNKCMQHAIRQDDCCRFK